MSGRGYDRVGGSRLTWVGAALLTIVVVGVANPPPLADRQIAAVVWVAAVATLVVGAVWPMVAVRRVEMQATSPRDATVGEQVPIEVTVTGLRGGGEVRALDPTGTWRRVPPSGSGTLLHLADRRGLFQVLRLEVRVTAPFGVLGAHRVHAVRLPHAVEVAPRALDVDWRPAAAPIEGAADGVAPAVLDGDLVRSVRPYAPGDPAHLVHWPSTARTGTLVVRELEPPAPRGQAIVVDLRELGADRERAASYALGAAWAVLLAGGELVLCTAEAEGPVTARTRTPLDAGRRLARAVVGEPGAPPAGWPVVEIGRST